MNEPNTTRKLMTIGVFSRRARLSSKALRLYDSMGLLVPATVDDQSGYRYYAEEQIERARLIGLLRRLEMPLNRIAETLELRGADAVRSISAYWREVEADMRVKRELVHYLENHLEGRGETMFEISTRHVPEQKVAFIQQRVHADGLPDFIRTSMQEAFAALAAAGAEPAGTPFVVYRGQVDLDSDGPVETCIPFDGSLEPQGAIGIRMEPEHAEAYTRLTREQVAFPGILEAYDAVERHLKEHGRTCNDAPREVYFEDWGAVGEDDPACDIAYPYAD